MKSVIRRYQAQRRQRALVREARFKAIQAQLQLEQLAVTSQSMGVGNPVSEKIVVSLTSYPARISTLFIVIESLLRQTLQPDQLLLWLSREDFPGEREDLPQSLLMQEQRGLEIRFVDSNYRSYKKIVHAIDDCADSVIITVDDDLIYPVDLIDLLYLEHRKHPNEVVCNRGRRMKLDGSGKPAKYQQWPLITSSEGYGLDIVPTGNYGVLYPPGSLHSDVTDAHTHQQLAPFADDLWFKAMSAKNGVVSRVISDRRHSRTRFLPIAYTSGVGLRDGNRSVALGNDAQMLALWDHFSLGELIQPQAL